MNMDPMNVIPMVIESGTRGERAFDIYSLLLAGAYYFSWDRLSTTRLRI